MVVGRAGQPSDATGVTQPETDDKTKHASVLFQANPSAAGHADMLPACVVVVVFYLACASRSVAPLCSDSVRPLDDLDPRRLEGTWALVGGSFSDPADMEFFKSRNSSSIRFSRLRLDNATANFVFTTSFHLGGKCQFSSYNVTLTGGVLAFDLPDEENITMTLLRTSCRDCLVMHTDSEPKTSRHLYLFSRRRQVQVEEAEEFQAQVECLNMLPPAAMDPAVQLCWREEENSQEKPYSQM